MTVVEMYVDLIHKKVKTINDIPDSIKKQVMEILESNPKSDK